MGFRFRRAIKLTRRTRINIGKRGPTSLTIGRFNLGSKGFFASVRTPIKGLSYRTRLGPGLKVKRKKRRK